MAEEAAADDKVGFEGSMNMTILAEGIITKLNSFLGKSSVSKNELKELDKDLLLLGPEDVKVLLEADVVALMLGYLSVDSSFEVVFRLLNTLSMYDEAKRSLWAQDGTSRITELLLSHCKTAKGDKQVDKAQALAKLVTVYSIDAPEGQVVWLKSFAEALRAALDKCATKNSTTEAYVMLCVALTITWIGGGSNLAPIFAASIIAARALPLLLKLAQVSAWEIVITGCSAT